MEEDDGDSKNVCSQSQSPFPFPPPTLVRMRTVQTVVFNCDPDADTESVVSTDGDGDGDEHEDESALCTKFRHRGSMIRVVDVEGMNINTDVDTDISSSGKDTSDSDTAATSDSAATDTTPLQQPAARLDTHPHVQARSHAVRVEYALCVQHNLSRTFIRVKAQGSRGARLCTPSCGHEHGDDSNNLALITVDDERFARDRVCVSIEYSFKQRCFVVTNNTTGSDPASASAGAWLGVGTHIRHVHVHPVLRGFPAMMLQQGVVFKTHQHLFFVSACSGIRDNMRSKHVAAPVPLSRLSASASGVIVEVDSHVHPDGNAAAAAIEDDQNNARVVITCIYPTTTPLYYKPFVFSYNYGGDVMKIGSHASCTMSITDGSLDEVHCRVVALWGQFWLVDGREPACHSSTGTYVQLLPTSDPVPLRVSTSPLNIMLGDIPVPLRVEVVRV